MLVPCNAPGSAILRHSRGGSIECLCTCSTGLRTAMGHAHLPSQVSGVAARRFLQQTFCAWPKPTEHGQASLSSNSTRGKYRKALSLSQGQLILLLSTFNPGASCREGGHQDMLIERRSTCLGRCLGPVSCLPQNSTTERSCLGDKPTQAPKRLIEASSNRHVSKACPNMLTDRPEQAEAERAGQCKWPMPLLVSAVGRRDRG